MKLKLLINHFKSKKTNRLLIVLIVLDILFVFTHALFIFLIFKRVEFDWSISDMFLINLDGGYPEIFQYLKYFMIIVIIIYIIYKRKALGYVSWLLLFIMLLLDDALQFHERFSEWVVEMFNYQPMFGLRAQDLGELTYVAVFGPIILLFLILGFYKGDKKFRNINIDLALLFALFLFFGVVVDMLHSLTGGNRYTLLFMILLEDGGEMIVLSVIAWYFYYIALRYEKHDNYLYQYFIKSKFLKKFADKV